MEISQSKALIQTFLSSDGFWAINKVMARILGYAETALLMELVYGDDHFEHDLDEVFPYPQENLEILDPVERWTTNITTLF